MDHMDLTEESSYLVTTRGLLERTLVLVHRQSNANKIKNNVTSSSKGSIPVGAESLPIGIVMVNVIISIIERNLLFRRDANRPCSTTERKFASWHMASYC